MIWRKQFTNKLPKRDKCLSKNVNVYTNLRQLKAAELYGWPKPSGSGWLCSATIWPGYKMTIRLNASITLKNNSKNAFHVEFTWNFQIKKCTRASWGVPSRATLATLATFAVHDRLLGSNYSRQKNTDHQNIDETSLFAFKTFQAVKFNSEYTEGTDVPRACSKFWYASRCTCCVCCLLVWRFTSEMMRAKGANFHFWIVIGRLNDWKEIRIQFSDEFKFFTLHLRDELLGFRS